MDPNCVKTGTEKENMEPKIKNDFLKFRDGNYSELLATVREWKYEPTFFQVIGKEHIEEIMVNTLAFFINPRNPHSFEDHIYNVFCQAIENRLIENDDYERLDYGEFKSLKKEITHKNDAGKSGRLDLIINCQNCIIGIEAKIRHFVKNPFVIYDDLLKNEAEKSSQDNDRKVILCKRGTKIPDEAEDWIEVNWEDIVIEDIDPNDDYAPLWEGMKIAFRGEKRMNDEDLELVAKNQEDYLLMYKMIENISKELEKRATALKTAVESCELNIDDTNFRIWGTFGQHAEPRVVIEKTKKSETKYVVDIIVSAKGYRFLAFDRGDSAQPEIDKSLEKAGFNFVRWKDLLDNNLTDRALITTVPDDLKDGLEPSDDKNEFFSGDVKQIAKIAVKIYSLITES